MQRLFTTIRLVLKLVYGMNIPVQVIPKSIPTTMSGIRGPFCIVGLLVLGYFTDVLYA